MEQLRALENGYRIRVVETEYESLGVDTPEDLERVSKLFEWGRLGGLPDEAEQAGRPAPQGVLNG